MWFLSCTSNTRRGFFQRGLVFLFNLYLIRFQQGLHVSWRADLKGGSCWNVSTNSFDVFRACVVPSFDFCAEIWDRWMWTWRSVSPAQYVDSELWHWKTIKDKPYLTRGKDANADEPTNSLGSDIKGPAVFNSRWPSLLTMHAMSMTPHRK